MIIRRVLPPDEWHKVADREPYATNGLPNPDHWLILVVEEDDQIVASAALFDAVHWDGFDVAPTHRGRPAIFGGLLTLGIEVLQQRGVPHVHCTIAHSLPGVSAMAERFGFVPAPGKLHLLAVPPATPE